MTTKLIIKNAATSNGDVHIRAVHSSGIDNPNLKPGEQTEAWITDSTVLSIFETCPATELASRHAQAGDNADAIIAGEVARQDKMWGVSNDRADSANGELLNAGIAQGFALLGKRNGDTTAFDAAPPIYPPEWSGFRDYGSDVANLAVIAAYVRQEMKRLIVAGADTTRKSRDPAVQPYTGDQPATYTK
jgi:hypothetical protein